MSLSLIAAAMLAAQVPGPSGGTVNTPVPAPQDAARSQAGAKIGAASQAFAACLQPAAAAVPASQTPEQGADTALAACATEKTALEAAVNEMIAIAPVEQQSTARQKLADSMARARTQIADGIRQYRAAQPATPPAK